MVKLSMISTIDQGFSVVGEKCTVYVNPDNGIITTIHKTHTKTVEKLKGNNKDEN